MGRRHHAKAPTPGTSSGLALTDKDLGTEAASIGSGVELKSEVKEENGVGPQQTVKEEGGETSLPTFKEESEVTPEQTVKEEVVGDEWVVIALASDEEMKQAATEDPYM